MERTNRSADELMVLASPRSGTNYFCESLKSFREIYAFFELFNPAVPFGVGPQNIPALNAILGMKAQKAREFRPIFRDQPLVALDALGKITSRRGKSIVSYKVFPNQVPPETLDVLIGSENRHPLFLVRGRLDTYISLMKAREVKSFKRTSTVDVLPEIDVDAFLRWAAHTDDFYQFCFDAARRHGKESVVVRYEADIDLPRADVLARVQRALSLLGLEVALPDRVAPVGFTRQDQRVDPFRKIANGEQLGAALRAAGKYEYALTAPLADEAADLAPMTATAAAS